MGFTCYSGGNFSFGEYMEDQIKIIYEDEDILVLDKPSGLVVNRSNTHSGFTLQDWVENNINFTFSDPESEFSKREGIVHRLDKDTSGILVVAKNLEAFIHLQKQFKTRQTEKEYMAVVNGRVEESLLEINAPIGRSPRNPLKFAIVSNGKESCTTIERVKNIKIGESNFALLRVFPKSGRTHQIRVHLSATNHSIVMDSKYCARNVLKVNERYFTRLMLHARVLSFFHPKTNKKVQFESPLPKAFNI